MLFLVVVWEQEHATAVNIGCHVFTLVSVSLPGDESAAMRNATLMQPGLRLIPEVKIKDQRRTEIVRARWKRKVSAHDSWSCSKSVRGTPVESRAQLLGRSCGSEWHALADELVRWVYSLLMLGLCLRENFHRYL